MSEHSDPQHDHGTRNVNSPEELHEMLARSAATEQADARDVLVEEAVSGKGEQTPSFEQTPRKMAIGIACVLIGGTCWGVNGAVSKILMEEYHAAPLWIACVREIIAGIIFLVAAMIGTPHSLRSAVTSWREYPKFVGAALTCVTLVQVAYLFSIQWTNAGTATVLQTVNLLMVLIYVCVRAKRRPTKREVIGVALAFVGVWLLATGGKLSTLSMPLPGLFWGLMDAFSCACLAIIPVGLIARYGNLTFNGLTFLISGLILLPFVKPWQNMPHFDARGWWLMAFTVVVGTVVAFWLFMAGVVRIGSMRATLLATIEPVTATISSVLWTGSVFTPVDIVGFVLILIMSFLVQ